MRIPRCSALLLLFLVVLCNASNHKRVPPPGASGASLATAGVRPENDTQSDTTPQQTGHPRHYTTPAGSYGSSPGAAVPSRGPCQSASGAEETADASAAKGRQGAGDALARPAKAFIAVGAAAGAVAAIGVIMLIARRRARISARPDDPVEQTRMRNLFGGGSESSLCIPPPPPLQLRPSASSAGLQTLYDQPLSGSAVVAKKL
ncbi:hypothetical protein H4R18_000804 [Coemansia javaensis]|uniref:Mid2 domain-containing protein n=1 Tax=Coemansia javaensis TaxID=2761396 RepID=A0A9W8HFQ1_9FUNG|nr:hypothetical protein H4R18_000804 [Coemansia javaensis]